MTTAAALGPRRTLAKKKSLPKVLAPLKQGALAPLKASAQTKPKPKRKLRRVNNAPIYTANLSFEEPQEIDPNDAIFRNEQFAWIQHGLRLRIIKAIADNSDEKMTPEAQSALQNMSLDNLLSMASMAGIETGFLFGKRNVAGSKSTYVQTSGVANPKYPNDFCTMFVLLKKSECRPELWQMIKDRLLTAAVIGDHCQGDVNADYIQDVSWPRTTHVGLILKHVSMQAHVTMQGKKATSKYSIDLTELFMNPARHLCALSMGSMKNGLLNESHIRPERVPAFYLDILCSSKRKGAALIRHLADYCRENYIQGMYLYAAYTPQPLGVGDLPKEQKDAAVKKAVSLLETKLVNWYKQQGFKRSTYICPLLQDHSATRQRTDDHRTRLVRNYYMHQDDGLIMSYCIDPRSSKQMQQQKIPKSKEMGYQAPL